MKCKACDVELSERETRQKDRDTGDFLDLCSSCFTVSQRALEPNYVTHVEPEPVKPPQDPRAAFRAFVQVNKLGDQWRDGLGLIDPETRYRDMYNRAYGTFLDLLQDNVPVISALERACKINQFKGTIRG